MTTAEERRKYAEDQIKKDYENKDTGGVGKGVLDFSMIGGYRKDLFWKPTTEDKYNRIDIIPFLASENNYQKVPVGMPAYKLEAWVHRYIGPDNLTFVCLHKMFGKPCPICEEREILTQDPSTKKEVLEKLDPKHRAWYVISDKNSNNKFQIFEESFNLFQKELMIAAGAGGRFVTFQLLETGKTIEFLAVKKNYKSYSYNEYRQFNFIDRPPYPERIYPQVYPLDKMLIIPTYSEVRNAYYNIDGDLTVNQPHVQGLSNKQETHPVFGMDVDPVAVAMENGGRVIDTASGQVDTNTGEILNKCPNGYDFGKQCDEFRECTTCPEDIYDECNKLYQASRG